jgi:hypothetical protein
LVIDLNQHVTIRLFTVPTLISNCCAISS